MIDEKLHEYIEKLIPKRPELLQKMEVYAKEHNVPIMEQIGIETLLQLLRIQEPKTILEVGTAIGYSALRMVYCLPDVKIVTIERDQERAELAEKNFLESGKKEQIVLIKGDALEVEDEIKQQGLYDVIFIDAAKGQYKKFFEMYSPYLAEKGIIITDNVLHKGLVVSDVVIRNRRKRALIKKINNFNYWLMNHPDYHTMILPIGDGIAISKKR